MMGLRRRPSKASSRRPLRRRAAQSSAAATPVIEGRVHGELPLRCGASLKLDSQTTHQLFVHVPL